MFLDCSTVTAFTHCSDSIAVNAILTVNLSQKMFSIMQVPKPTLCRPNAEQVHHQAQKLEPGFWQQRFGAKPPSPFFWLWNCIKVIL